MTVTAIIPVYNAAATIGEAIESLISQSDDLIEVIIVDNGSSDDSVAKIIEYADRYPDLIRLTQEEKQGAAAARNHGLRLATGDLIQFVDADDVLLPGKISRQITLFRDDVEWLMGASVIEDNRYGEVVFAVKQDPWLSLIYEGGIGNMGSNMFLRSTLMNLKGFDENLPDGEDLELYFRLLKRKCLYVVDHEPGYVYKNSFTETRLTTVDLKGRLARQVDLTVKVISYLRKERPAYYWQKKKQLNSALLRAISRQLRVDYDAGKNNFQAFFEGGLAMENLCGQMLPGHSFLYPLLGYLSVEALALTVGKTKRFLRGLFLRSGKGRSLHQGL